MKKRDVRRFFDRNGNGSRKEIERTSRYFFNLEKRNYNRKTITELRINDNEREGEEGKILEAIEKFYEDLYSSKTTVSQVDFDEFKRDVEFPKLDNEEKKI